jgi:Protein kinase domain
MHDEVIINPSWDFQTAVSAASERFQPGSLIVGKARNVLIQSWAQMVGRQRALQEVNDYIDRMGSLTAAAKSLLMSTDTLKRLLEFITSLPTENEDIQPIKLKRGQQKLYEFLRTRNQGDIVSRRELREALGWANSTLNTYIRKNMLNEFLEPLDKNNFALLTNKKDISPALIATSFSQVQNHQVFIARGEILKSTFSQYILQARIGNGAVGQVWRVQDKKTGELKALKVMNPRRDLLKPTVLQNVKRRFSREARNGLRLKNQNIISYRDWGDYKRSPFIVMDLADFSLKQKLKKIGKLDLSESLVVIESGVKGLIYLHKNRHIHRDIKPDNILAVNGTYVLGDLGIVKWSDFSDEYISAGTITKNDMQLGSWFYMAPEQSETPSSATQSSDIYALGVTWYEMLTLDHMSPAKIASGRFADPCQLKDVNLCIRKMLDYEPSIRPTAEEVLIVVQSVRSGLTSAA